ncbi:MAG: glycosyltransferase family 4 protein [Deltaproteobacteria bacterium]|nr:glycosyltransferase family 4 protein [Deltaproteobacteria bacterium]
MNICMFVTNPISSDARVRHEAAHLSQAGHAVTVLGTPGPGLPATEDVGGVIFRRIGRIGHWMDPLLRSMVLRRRDDSGASTASGGNGRKTVAPSASDIIWRVAPWIGALRTLVPWLPVALTTRADVFHAHDLDTLVYAWTCSKLTGARLVYDSHELFVDWQRALGARPGMVAWYEAVERRCIKDASLVITVSDGIAAELEREYGIDTPLVVRNCDRMRPLADGTERLKGLYGGGSGRPVVLYQGGITAHRGLLEAAKAADYCPDADFVFLGPDSRFKKGLMQAAGRARYGNVFVLPAVPQDELWEYTCGATIGLVLTQPFCRSYALSESNKLYQYMMAGLPIVAGSIESHQRVADETGALVLADPYDPKAIAGAIIDLLEDEKRLRKMGREGRSWAERKYNAVMELDKLTAAYDGFGP